MAAKKKASTTKKTTKRTKVAAAKRASTTRAKKQTLPDFESSWKSLRKGDAFVRTKTRSASTKTSWMAEVFYEAGAEAQAFVVVGRDRSKLRFVVTLPNGTTRRVDYPLDAVAYDAGLADVYESESSKRMIRPGFGWQKVN